MWKDTGVEGYKNGGIHMWRDDMVMQMIQIAARQYVYYLLAMLASDMSNSGYLAAS